MFLGKLPVPGRPTIWMIVGQGPIALAVGAGGGCLDIFILIYPFSPLSPPSLGAVPGRPTILITGQGPTTLAVGAGGVVWTFLLSSVLSLLCLGDGPI